MFLKPNDPLVLALPEGDGRQNVVDFVTGAPNRMSRDLHFYLWVYPKNGPEHLAAFKALGKHATYTHRLVGMRQRRQDQELQQQQAKPPRS